MEGIDGLRSPPVDQSDAGRRGYRESVWTDNDVRDVLRNEAVRFRDALQDLALSVHQCDAVRGSHNTHIPVRILNNPINAEDLIVFDVRDSLFAVYIGNIDATVEVTDPELPGGVDPTMPKRYDLPNGAEEYRYAVSDARYSILFKEPVGC